MAECTNCGVKVAIRDTRHTAYDAWLCESCFAAWTIRQDEKEATPTPAQLAVELTDRVSLVDRDYRIVWAKGCVYRLEAWRGEDEYGMEIRSPRVLAEAMAYADIVACVNRLFGLSLDPNRLPAS